MKRYLLFLVALLVSMVMAAADKLPKKVGKARASVASVLTYRNGTLKENGTAVFVGGRGEAILSCSLLAGADSAVVIGADGKARPVQGIVGLNNIYDCVKVRVVADKKITYMPVSSTGVPVGGELYMLSYGRKGGGNVTKVNVVAVDSLYSNAYYTLDARMQDSYVSMPLVNGDGELIAILQPATTGDTCSYAISSVVSDQLVTTSVNFGKGYHSGMGIRTLLPDDKDAALSCMYMQAMVGDSSSYRRVVDDFINAFPKSYEGYLCKAEYLAVYCRDMDAADVEWNRAFSLSDKPSEVYFNRAKVVHSIVLGGDSTSHEMLSFGRALEDLDRAIESNNEPMYVNYKADMLFSHGLYAEAAACYESLSSTVLKSPELFARASQCYGLIKEYNRSIELLDSAVNTLGDAVKLSAPYVLTRAIVKMTAGRYRDAVLDFNRYEEANGGSIANANFYYMRGQAELGGKMYQQALNDFEMSIYLEPENPLYYIEKGVLCYRVRLVDEGIRSLEKAKELATGAVDVYYLLGCLYAGNSENVLAKENLEKAKELGHPGAEEKLNELK